MRNWLLLGLLLAVPTAVGAGQDAPIDPALVRQYIDADTIARKTIANRFDDHTVVPFNTAIMASGNEAIRIGKPKDAIRAFEAALELSSGFNTPRGVVVAMNGPGMVYGQTGDYTAGVRYLSGALENSSQVDDDDLVAAISTNLGNIYRRRAQYDQALAMYSRALATHEAANREVSIARVLNNLGN